MITAAPENPLNDELPVSVSCRFTGPTCLYLAAGPEDFVRANYKQHLREVHRISEPAIESEISRPAMPAAAR